VAGNQNGKGDYDEIRNDSQDDLEEETMVDLKK
jgi:hypothetical protein